MTKSKTWSIWIENTINYTSTLIIRYNSLILNKTTSITIKDLKPKCTPFAFDTFPEIQYDIQYPHGYLSFLS